MSFAFTETRGLLSWVIKFGVGGDIQATCWTCKGLHRFTMAEIVALAEKVGEDFSFYNRRCRCRLTPGCEGWNQFYFLPFPAVRGFREGFALKMAAQFRPLFTHRFRRLSKRTSAQALARLPFPAR